MNCLYGGNCIDLGKPSNCEANGTCVNFASTKQRQDFDALPDRYYFKYPEGIEMRSKNKNQLDFLLADLPDRIKQNSQWGVL